jgi:hypothetical protein
MPKLYRNAAIAVKIETTSGTDSVPTAAANALLVRNFTWNPIEMTVEERDLVRPYLGNSEDIVVARWITADFEVEMAGAGTAGTVPKYDALLRMCGHSATTSAGVSVTYAPISTGFETASMYCNLDQVLHKSVFAMGSVGFGLDARKIPVFKVKVKGLFLPLTDTTAWSPVYTGFVKPIAVNKQNTTLSFQGVNAAVETLQIDANASIEYRNLYNSEAVLYTDRKPGGSLSLEMTSVATKDWLAGVEAANTGALSVVHGTTAGNIVALSCPGAQLTQPKYANSQGVMMLQGNLKLVPGAAGNDEYTLVVR